MHTAYRLPFVSTTCAKASIERTADERLVEMIAANGDKHAMQLLYARHSVRVYRFISRLTRNDTIAEDVVSEVFLEVWRGAARFKAQSQVSTWLLAIARNKAISACRRQSEIQWEDRAAALIEDPAVNPEIAANDNRRTAIIRACLMQIPPADREIIDLVYYHEKPLVEVAQIIGIPMGTVKSRMFNARSKMAELLKQAGVDGLQTC